MIDHEFSHCCADCGDRSCGICGEPKEAHKPPEPDIHPFRRSMDPRGACVQCAYPQAHPIHGEDPADLPTALEALSDLMKMLAQEDLVRPFSDMVGQCSPETALKLGLAMGQAMRVLEEA